MAIEAMTKRLAPAIATAGCVSNFRKSERGKLSMVLMLRRISCIQV